MQERRINFNPAPMPLATIIGNIKNVNRGGLDLQPEYQRDYVWNQDFKEKLIYSLISMCQVNVGNFFIFFSNPLTPIASTFYLFCVLSIKHSLFIFKNYISSLKTLSFSLYLS